MKIHLGENLYLMSDKYQFNVAREEQGKKGPIMRRRSGYFRRADEAVRDFIEREVKGSNAETLDELIVAAQAVAAVVNAACEKVAALPPCVVRI